MKNGLAIVLLAAAVSHPATAQPSDSMPVESRAESPPETTQQKDQIGLTATQRQMIAWSVAGLAAIQPVPPSFQAVPGMKVPPGVSMSRVPGIVQGVAPPAAGYDYAMFDNQDLLLVKPQDGTIADVIHLDRRL